MIRVLHAVHAVTKGDGLANFIMNYYRKIDRSKIQFDFLFFREDENDFKAEIKELGGRCFYLEQPSLKTDFRKDGYDFFESHKGEFTVFHCHVFFAAAFYGKIAKKFGVKSVILHSHNTVYGVSLSRKIRNFFLIKYARSIADRYAACGDQAARFMFGDHAFESGQVTVFRNAIEIEKYGFSKEKRERIREELNIDNCYVLGHVGSFTMQKNHKFLIEIFDELLKIKPDAKLLLMGGDGIAVGSTMEEIHNMVIDRNIEDKVCFLGLRSDVGNILSAIDCFVLPSLFEGLPFSAIEAQTSGCHCVVSDTVTKEVNIGLCNFISLSKDAKEWAREILVYQEIDFSRNNGMEMAKKLGYSIEDEADKLQQYYQNF